MAEGFYFYRKYVYYGCYKEEQVSGGGKISKIKQAYVKTNVPISEDDRAVQLWDNHCLLQPEYEDLQEILFKINSFSDLNTEQECDFLDIESRLDIVFPKELKLIYNAIHNQEKYFNCVEHFLPLDEIYVEQGVVVFFKKKRTAIAGYDIESGCLARYQKKEWNINRGDMCCYQFCIGRILTITLESFTFTKKGRCKGRFVTTLNIEQELEKYCMEKYYLISEFNVYGIAVMYSKSGLIAWIRSNGLYADIHVGAVTEECIKDFGEHLGAIEWK